MNDKHNQMTLLAPAGSRAAFIAAVENGADAIYLGGKLFNARQFADNFEIEEITELTRYAHLNNVKVLITLNILILDEEIPALLKYAADLVNASIDGIIVQDLGVAVALRYLLPKSVEIHASTQMSIMNSPGVHFAEKLGLSQVVLAREVSLKNIKQISQAVNLKLESFGHGALCTAYSGQCLMSSMMGGRSGNRGQCAQPCRMKYKLLDNQLKPVPTEGEYLLSTKDLLTLGFLDELAEAGISVVKLEGRMKRPEYVAVITEQYRNQLDKHSGDYNKLNSIFNRGFTDGFYKEMPASHLMNRIKPDNQGLLIGKVKGINLNKLSLNVQLAEPLSIGDGIEVTQAGKNIIAQEVQRMEQQGQVVKTVKKGYVDIFLGEIKNRNNLASLINKTSDLYKTSDMQLLNEAKVSYSKPGIKKRISINLTLSAKAGQPLILKGWDKDGNYVEVISNYICETAINQPAVPEQIKKQLDRFGNSLFEVKKIELEIEPQIMVPASLLNQLRRQFIDRLEEKRLSLYQKELDKEDMQLKIKELNKYSNIKVNKSISKNQTNTKANLSIRIGDISGLKAALDAGIKEIYFGGEKYQGNKGIREFHEISQAIELCKKYGANSNYVIPRFIHEDQIAQIKDLCLFAKENGVSGYIASNPGAIMICKKWNLNNITVDWSLNIFNSLSVRLMEEMEIKRVCLSTELTLEQIKKISSNSCDLETVVHGRLPLMILEHCLPGSLVNNRHCNKSSDKNCCKGNYFLEDRMKFHFPILTDTECRNWIFNAKTLAMLKHIPKLLSSELNYYRIEARNEQPDWIYQVVKAYQRGIQIKDQKQWQKELGNYQEVFDKISPQGFTTGHYFRGVNKTPKLRED